MKYRVPGVFICWLVLAALVGCGGGGGGEVSAPPIDTELFSPNYISSLDMLLHWNHLPMRVSFETPDQSLVHGWTPEDVTQAANQWNQPGKQVLVTVVPAGAPADAVVRFVTRADLGGGSNATGITSITYNPTTRNVITAVVKVAPESPFGGWLGATDVKVTVAHEIGHALGIHGHSPNSGDLMVAVSQLGREYPPTPRDLNTVMSAYPTYFTPGAVGSQGLRVPSVDEGPFETITIE